MTVLSAKTNVIEATMQPIRRCHPDGAILFADILLVPDALGQVVDYREGEGPVLAPVTGPAALDRLGLDGLHDRLAPVYQTVQRLADTRAIPDHVICRGAKVIKYLQSGDRTARLLAGRRVRAPGHFCRIRLPWTRTHRKQAHDE